MSCCLASKNGCPRLSIVVPVRNNADQLGECLDVLLRTSTEQCEIIVVDDASSDDSHLQAVRRGVRLIPIARQSGPAAARNTGARAARGDLLFFVDSDVLVSDRALGRVIDTFDNRAEIAAIFGSYDCYPRAAGVISQYRNLLHHFIHQSGSEDASTFWAGCGAVRRDVFERLGGFDAHRFPRSSIEDIELGYRLRKRGYRILLDKHLRCTHLKRWTLFSVVYTDIFLRAVPWSWLLLERRRLAGDLNLQRTQQLSVALTVIGVACLLFSPLHAVSLVFSAAALAAVVSLNWKFLTFLARKRDLLFAASCAPLLLLHYLCGGVGVVYVWIGFHFKVVTGDRLARERQSQ